MADLNGKIVKKLTNTTGYDAEATLSPDGEKMLFTSTRNGDLDLYVMELKTGKIKQITKELGYDGGAWFSADGKKIIWRASRPKTEADIKEYKEFLAENLVAPTQMEVFIANSDGSGAKQITSLGQANWAPNFLKDGRIIFCSNAEYKRGFPFNMYLLNEDGSGLKKISHDKGFDAFPMMSPNGKKILFCSNRNNGGTRDTNVFCSGLGGLKFVVCSFWFAGQVFLSTLFGHRFLEVIRKRLVRIFTLFLYVLIRMHSPTFYLPYTSLKSFYPGENIDHMPI
jgi:Tol biopolymer transport system component